MLVNLFTDYNRTKLTLADTINITTDQLHSLYLLFEELERIPDACLLYTSPSPRDA